MTIIPTLETLPLAEVKTRLSELVTRVQQQHDQVTVTRNGRPAAVVVSVDEWESLHETLEILADTDTVAAILQARQEVARGEVYPTDEVLDAFHQRKRQAG
ncbi:MULTISPECIES: type II toxin-antitoxin system Phd/YefM family antitoxin [unclassified Frankia]|uniref:type II toxin-antitoxin system Phd/YefM family antitoxin n=1 Tax=unclassified Frankia TaxID=2632575 RepID=UPI002AD3F880|nr:MULTISPECIES: type II toxin-antitoxin system Phd/YefM family antitoxin [unclassified Frankia]